MFGHFATFELAFAIHYLYDSDPKFNPKGQNYILKGPI